MGHLPELLAILVVALIVFGPKRLPEIGASLGKAYREFRRFTAEMEQSVSLDVQPRPRPTPGPPPLGGARLNPPFDFPPSTAPVQAAPDVPADAPEERASAQRDHPADAAPTRPAAPPPWE